MDHKINGLILFSIIWLIILLERSRHVLIIYFIRFRTEIAVKIDFINKTLTKINEINVLMSC